MNPCRPTDAQRSALAEVGVNQPSYIRESCVIGERTAGASILWIAGHSGHAVAYVDTGGNLWWAGPVAA